MKYLDLNWLDGFHWLEIWRQLSVEDRRRLSKLPFNSWVDGSQFDHDVESLLELQILRGSPNNQKQANQKQATEKLAIHSNFRSFQSFINVLGKHDVIGRPTIATFIGYLRENFSEDQRRNLYSPQLAFGNVDRMLADAAVSASWVRQFLAAEDGREWEDQRLPPRLREASRFRKVEVFTAAKMLVQEIVDSSGPVLMHELPHRMENVEPRLLAWSLSACLRYLLLIPALQYEDLLPVIDVWPTAGDKLRAPPSSAPAIITPDETFHCAYQMEDMTALMAEAAVQPLRFKKNDGRLFAKAVKSIQPRLVVLPDWLSKRYGVGDEKRIYDAQHLLQDLGFLNTNTLVKECSFTPSAKGKRWLADDAPTRLRTILESLQKKQLIPHSMFYHIQYNRNFNPVPLLFDAFRAVPREDAWPWDQFLTWRAETKNPLREHRDKQQNGMFFVNYSWQRVSDEDLERIWSHYLEELLRTRLLPLGGVEMGFCRTSQRLTLRMTEIGRCLFGDTDIFQYGIGERSKQQSDQKPAGQVIVQPNFEIAFLRPWPMAEAAISRYADRVGKGLGVLFRVSKQTMMAAAASGLTAEQVLAELSQIAAKGVPPNVEREIRGWFGQCRRVSLRTAILIRCPDADTAGRVQAAGGKEVKPISDTVLELPDAKSKANLVRKLAQAGVYVE